MQQLDIRTPMAFMFGILGAILTVYGLVKMGDAEFHRRALGVNINLWWGTVMLVFALAMFLWSRSGKPDGKAK